jgi:hypothetical protein
MLAALLPKPPGSTVEPVAPSVLSTLVNDALLICALYVPMMFWFVQPLIAKAGVAAESPSSKAPAVRSVRSDLFIDCFSVW